MRSKSWIERVACLVPLECLSRALAGRLGRVCDLFQYRTGLEDLRGMSNFRFARKDAALIDARRNEKQQQYNKQQQQQYQYQQGIEQ